ncbi:MAG: hypothetical protein H7061_02330 [Bdellovibrionaceae bacterium]|nr:hypothetical protein [Bdellovibrio sp.]
MFPAQPSHSIQVIADSVLQLSNYYIQNPNGETPWRENFCQIAYRNYYFPLNQLRCAKVIERGQGVNFFEDLTYFVDWGSGPGTASFALAENKKLKSQIKKQFLVDISSGPHKSFADLHSNLISPSFSTTLDFKSYLDQKSSTCFVFSYSMTEIARLPAGWDQAEALMILEPATSQDGRKLLQLRQELIEKGYSMWAPCLHQLACPLLKNSNHDWCHDRFIVDAPAWFWQVDQLLPMKNKTITTSYLLARKKLAFAYPTNNGRLTGDSREEKGKTRQLVCRNEEREFLTWMHKSITPQTFPRGEIVEISDDFEFKSNELRVKYPCRTR